MASYWCEAGCTRDGGGNSRTTSEHTVIHSHDVDLPQYSLFRLEVLECTNCKAVRSRMIKKQTPEQKFMQEVTECFTKRKKGICLHKDGIHSHTWEWNVEYREAEKERYAKYRAARLAAYDRG